MGYHTALNPLARLARRNFPKLFLARLFASWSIYPAHLHIYTTQQQRLSTATSCDSCASAGTRKLWGGVISWNFLSIVAGWRVGVYINQI